MKALQAILTAGMALLMAIPSMTAGAQTARVQAIHNSADPSASSVDVYLGDDLLVDDFAFRTATPFIDAPAGTEIVFGIAPSTSTSSSDVIATFPFTLTEDETYVVVASGVLDPPAFAPNPDGEDTAFTLLVRAGARETAEDPAKIEAFGVHGVTDAPSVDVLIDEAVVVDDAAFGDATDYVSFDESTVDVDVTPGNDNTLSLASFEVDLSGLAGRTGVVLASGFFDPSANQNGPGLAAVVVFPDGTVVEAPFATEDGDEGCTYSKGFWKNHEESWPDGTSPHEPFFDGELTWLEMLRTPPKRGNAYIILAHQYIAAYLNVVNGADDSEASDYLTRAEELLSSTTASDPPFRHERQEYLEIAEWLDGYNNGHFGPGHCDDQDEDDDDADDDDGDDDGDDDDFARVQVIHNAADPALATVDVYVNGDRVLDDFAFRSATPFLDVPAEETLVIGLAPGDSESAADAILSLPVVLEEEETYIGIATGVLDPAAFAENPDGRSIGLTVLVKEDARERAGDSGMVTVFAGHNVTDAPTVDVVARDVGVLVDNAAYGDLTDYLDVPVAAYVLDVTAADDNTAVVASFAADLTGLGGLSAVVLASGFLDPSTNQDGPGFALIAVLADGTVIELPTGDSSGDVFGQVGIEATGEVPRSLTLSPAYPNPFNPSTRIEFGVPESENVTLTVYDSLGRLVRVLVSGPVQAGTYAVTFDAESLPSGTYLYRIVTAKDTKSGSVVLLK